MTTSISSVNKQSFLKKLELTDGIFNYWIFLYSYEQNFMDKKLDPTKIHLFNFYLHTPFKNRGLYLFNSHRQLDLSSDDDLELVIKTFGIRGVKSVSEFTISKNTNIICLELKNKKYRKLYRTQYVFFYTIYNSPSYYLNHLEYLDEEQTILIPQNKYLLTKLRLHVPQLGCITTNVLLNRVFKFLFDDLFKEKLKEYKDIKIVSSDLTLTEEKDNIDDLKNMFRDMVLKRKLETDESVISRNEEEDENEEEEEEDSDSDVCSDDSGLSFYSYQKKYGLPVNVKDI